MRLKEYRTWLFDLDGTLYRQTPLRLEMALRLATYYGTHPWRLRELMLLREYRLTREKFFLSDEENFARLRAKYGLEPTEIIRTWMVERALSAVRRWRRTRVLRAIEEHRARGGLAIVYSDYPVEEKLRALGLTADYEYWSGDEIIDCLKPEASGLMRVMETLRLECGEILYVGDRDDRDGECARRAGVDYIDIKVFERRIEEK